jgi:hypothetical protein
MKLFKHPIRSIREPFGLAGVIVACVALVAALGGGAYAASGGLSGKQKKEVEKIAKKYAGKPGANGTNGAPGTKGDIGAKGDTGAAGTSGTNGTNGTNVTTSAASEAECGKAGGVKITSASPATKVCNGTTGFTKTLPKGETETGTWAASSTSTTGFSAGDFVSVPISFPIPLAAEGATQSAFVFNKADTAASQFGASGCAGTVATPTAPPGKLCVYTFDEELVEATPLEGLKNAEGQIQKYGQSGAILEVALLNGSAASPAGVLAWGSWAVTAP